MDLSRFAPSFIRSPFDYVQLLLFGLIRRRLLAVARVSAMLVSMAVLMGVASVANLTGLTSLMSQISFVGTAHANDIQVTNTSVAEDSGAGVRVVSFDLSWENSWRVDNLFPDDPHNAINWDAGWVFLKYRTVGGAWKHATLMEDGFDAGVAVGENMGSGALMQVGLVDPGMAWHASENPGVGVMVYREEAGAGRFAVEGAQLRWNYAADGVSPEDDVAIALFAIEMVYVAPGAFYVGSGGAEDAQFVAGGAEGSGISANAPFLVTGNWDGCVSDTEGCLWAAGEAGANSMDEGGMLASGYTTGFSGFYGMKYEVSQQQYVDFLNTLPVAQAQARAYVGGEARNGISYVAPADGVSLSDGVAGYYTTSTPYVANNYMSWMDAAAYLDWAGLRPMTELEYEKAARGYADPVANEYAWGSTNIYSTGSATSYSNLGEATESVSQGNAVYNGSNPGGPARVGIFAGDATTREQSGAGYWGMMELSGNVWERCVTVGNEEGRGFTGLHGDGELSITGAGNVPSWPGIMDSEIVGEDGSGFRGAGYLPDAVNWLALSFRRYATDVNPGRFYDFGIRGARTMVAESIVSLTVQVLGAGAPTVGGTVSPASGSYAAGTQVELTAIPVEDWAFFTWTGDVPADLPDGVSVTDSVITVTMDSDKSVTAVFEQGPNFGRDTDTEVVDVVNPLTGITWMDRNLGASRTAMSLTDSEAYGDLYQWGRAADGHEKRNSSTRNTLSGGDQPSHSDFIFMQDNPYDWRSPQNDNLWQGVGGVNNPCPVGYRLPTESEWNVERGSWSSSNSAGAYGSPLKLPMAGYRSSFDGSIVGVDLNGRYWSHSVTNSNAIYLFLNSTNASMLSGYRARGYSVRCRKDGVSLKIDIEGNGSVDPAGGIFELGAEVELAANPADGWLFSTWTGDVPDGATATDNVLIIMMDNDKSLTAVFEAGPNYGRDTETEVVDVLNPVTGVTWMDRNLGASQVATGSTDVEGYGDLYQWGRAADGHQKRNSVTTNTLSTTDTPGNGNFIIIQFNYFDDPYDWRSPRNDNLWQGLEGINNPCPSGYRLPTAVDWSAERDSWGSDNGDGAYASPLKLTLSGRRLFVDGSIDFVGSYGLYWSSSVDGAYSRNLSINNGNAGVGSDDRARGLSVRCRKDEVSLQIGIEGNGMVDPVGGTFELGAEVEITATPDEGWMFARWEGDVSNGASTNNPLTLTMDSDKSVTAVFEQDLNFGRDTETAVVDVVNPATGVTWMDRNLGASRAATSSTDTESYGDLYQWGRATDGHEKRNSSTRSTTSNSDQPGHGDFITVNGVPYDWRSPQNDNLWQGAGGLNNPCPVGYRLPTQAEWEVERGSWNSNNIDGAYASPLKLPVAGYRNLVDGSLRRFGSSGDYWSSAVDGTSARNLYFNSSNANMYSNGRAFGFSVRCIKDGVSLKIDIEGNGSVDPEGGTFELGAEVEVTATPTVGWVFSGWTGDVPANLPDGAVTDSVLTFTMDSDKSVTAVFEEEGSTDGWPRDTQTAVVDVVNPATGVTWMDRNLGASRAATSLVDSEAYGDLYQWGRAADGHEKRTSSTRSTLSSSDQPAHGDFITTGSSPYDWRSPQNDNLWQGVDGINNPCPVGYRLPTVVEWNAERTSWSSNNRAGAYGSPLKLPVAGYRDYFDGSLDFVGSHGFYWSSSVVGTSARYLYFDSSNANASSYDRAYGFSVRCRED